MQQKRAENANSYDGFMLIPFRTRTRTRNNNPRADDGYYEAVAHSVHNATVKFIMESDSVSGEITYGYFAFPACITLFW